MNKTRNLAERSHTKKEPNGNSGTEQYKDELRGQAHLRFEQAEE